MLIASTRLWTLQTQNNEQFFEMRMITLIH